MDSSLGTLDLLSRSY